MGRTLDFTTGQPTTSCLLPTWPIWPQSLQDVSERYLHPDGQSVAAAGAALSAHLTARTADWSQSGPRLRLVQESADQPPTYKDAR